MKLIFSVNNDKYILECEKLTEYNRIFRGILVIFSEDRSIININTSNLSKILSKNKDIIIEGIKNDLISRKTGKIEPLRYRIGNFKISIFIPSDYINVNNIYKNKDMDITLYISGFKKLGNIGNIQKRLTSIETDKYVFRGIKGKTIKINSKELLSIIEKLGDKILKINPTFWISIICTKLYFIINHKKLS